MWKNLSPRNKLSLIVTLGVVILVLVYRISIEKTVDLYRENSRLSELNLTGEEEILFEIRSRTREKKQIDSLLTLYETGSSISDLTKIIFESAQQNKVNVVEISELTKARNGYLVKMHGSYIPLVQSLAHLEKNVLGCKIESVRFYIEVNRKTKRKLLFLELKLIKFELNE